MTVTPIGTLTVGGAVPGCAVAVANGEAGITAAIPDLTSRIDALTAFAPTPISFAEQISIANDIIASINAAISFGVVPPSNAAQVAEVTAQLAGLSAQLVVIEGQLAAITALNAPLAVGGIGAWVFDGDAADFGTELGPVIAGAFVGHINAIVMATGTPTSWDALGEIVKTTP